MCFTCIWQTAADTLDENNHKIGQYLMSEKNVNLILFQTGEFSRNISHINFLLNLLFSSSTSYLHYTADVETPSLKRKG